MSDADATLRSLVDTLSRNPGDSSRRRELCGRILPLIIGPLARNTQRASDREDLHHEVLLHTFRRIIDLVESRRVRPESRDGQLVLFFRTIALDTLRSVRRRQSRTRSPSPLADEPTAPAVKLDRMRMLHTALLPLLMTLGVFDRSVVALRYFEELPFRAIAAELGISEQCARVRASRAIERLREIAATDRPAHTDAAAPARLPNSDRR